MKHIATDSRDNKLYIIENEVGGHQYWSDEIGGCVLVWDASLVSIEMVDLAVVMERARIKYAPKEEKD